MIAIYTTANGLDHINSQMSFSATIASKRKLDAYLLLNITKLMYQCFKILPFPPNIMPSSIESPGRLSIPNFYVKFHVDPLLF